MAESLAHSPVLVRGGSIIDNRSFRAQPVIRIAAIRIVPIFYPKVALELVAEGASESYCGSMENPD